MLMAAWIVALGPLLPPVQWSDRPFQASLPAAAST
jgi:hypothetical protein